MMPTSTGWTLTINGVEMPGLVSVDYAPITSLEGTAAAHRTEGTLVCPPTMMFTVRRLITGGGITAEELRWRLARWASMDPLPLP